jgi:hypothetical protein
MVRTWTFALGVPSALLVTALAWIAILQKEQQALVRSLRNTETTLSRERRATEELEDRYRREIKALRERADLERDRAAEQHEDTIRSITAEALHVQIELVRMGWRPANWPCKSILRRPPGPTSSSTLQ